MNKFEPFSSHAVCLPNENVDTDQIIPARFLKVIDKAGLGKHLFADWRYNSDGSPKAEFVLNRAEAVGARILLAGDNFGCGSSREHAPWALIGFGFRAVISTSFADIFRQNCLKNGLIPIAVDRPTHARLFEIVRLRPHALFTVHLANQAVSVEDGPTVPFPIDSFAKTCLLEGLDELGYILKHENAIRAFEKIEGQGRKGIV